MQASEFSLLVTLVCSLAGCSSEAPLAVGSGEGTGAQASGTPGSSGGNDSGGMSASGGTASGGANVASGGANGGMPGGNAMGGTPGSNSTGVIAVASFVVPAGTVVQEFAMDVVVPEVSISTAGQVLEVAVLDVSRPDRDQAVLCPADHPLDGCSTVDYGAFGPTYDNRIVAMADSGALEIHLFKDRTLGPIAEPLLAGE